MTSFYELELNTMFSKIGAERSFTLDWAIKIVNKARKRHNLPPMAMPTWEAVRTYGRKYPIHSRITGKPIFLESLGDEQYIFTTDPDLIIPHTMKSISGIVGRVETTAPELQYLSSSKPYNHPYNISLKAFQHININFFRAAYDANEKLIIERKVR